MMKNVKLLLRSLKSASSSSLYYRLVKDFMNLTWSVSEVSLKLV